MSSDVRGTQTFGISQSPRTIAFTLALLDLIILAETTTAGLISSSKSAEVMVQFRQETSLRFGISLCVSSSYEDLSAR